MCLLGSDVHSHHRTYLRVPNIVPGWLALHACREGACTRMFVLVFEVIDFMKYSMAVIHTLIRLYAVHERGSTPYHIMGGPVSFSCVVLTIYDQWICNLKSQFH